MSFLYHHGAIMNDMKYSGKRKLGRYALLVASGAYFLGMGCAGPKLSQHPELWGDAELIYHHDDPAKIDTVFVAPGNDPLERMFPRVDSTDVLQRLWLNIPEPPEKSTEGHASGTLELK
jgi:hypothetical protein